MAETSLASDHAARTLHRVAEGSNGRALVMHTRLLELYLKHGARFPAAPQRQQTLAKRSQRKRCGENKRC